MTRTSITQAMRITVPAIVLLLVVGDVLLQSLIGAEATYTWQIRSWAYAYPSVGVFLAGGIGACWAHLCWTPGSEIAAIRRDLQRLGCVSAEERVILWPKASVAYSVIVDNGLDKLETDWHAVQCIAWREALALVLKSKKEK